MEENSWHGNFSTTPFPQLLLRLWEEKKSGRLKIQKGGEEKSVDFAAGDLALAEGFFTEEDFPKRLIEAKSISGEQCQEVLRHAFLNKISFPRALVERGILSPARVWELLIHLWQDDLFPLFNWTQADYVFDSRTGLPDSQIFTTLSTLDLILQGIRQMENSSLIEAVLPAETDLLQVYSADPAGFLNLTAPEKYVLKVLKHTPCLRDLYEQSQLGKKESQKVVYALIHLGLVGLIQTKNRAKPAGEFSSGELERMWSDFNERCSYIYKYISKEIGPVAQNVLGKALEEVKARLGPPLQNIELRSDGRVELKSFPLMSLNFYNEETRKNFLRLLNEILVTEVLAVKKTLGNSHEAALVKNLEKIGEPV